MKKLILGIGLSGLLLSSGCVPLIVAGVGATVGSGYLRYKGMNKEADAIDAVVEEVSIAIDDNNDTIKSDMVEKK